MSAEHGSQLGLDLENMHNRVLGNKQFRARIGTPASFEDELLNTINDSPTKAARSEILATPEARRMLRENIDRVRARFVSEGVPSDYTTETFPRDSRSLPVPSMLMVEVDLIKAPEGEEFSTGTVGHALAIATLEGEAEIIASLDLDDTYNLTVTFSNPPDPRNARYNSGKQPFDQITDEERRIWLGCLDKIK